MEDKTHIAFDNAHQPHPIARLTWDSAGTKMEKTIGGGGLTFGRSAENDLVVQDIEASRFHCKILPENERLIVVDLESTNGTFLNGKRVSGSSELHDGDAIRIGQLEFFVELLSPTPSVESPTIAEIPLDKTFLVLPEANLPRLVLISGIGRGTEFPLTKERMLIGRASSNKKWDIDLVDKAVSRPHAELVRKDNEWVLTDLNSANGTTINGARVTEPHVMKDGDAVSFGETTLIFRLAPGA